jgi:hypothetical protein
MWRVLRWRLVGAEVGGGEKRFNTEGTEEEHGGRREEQKE